MGTNYYVMQKDAFKCNNKMDNIIESISKDALKCTVRNSILKQYKKAITILPESRKDLFEDTLDEIIDKFLNDIKYNLEDIFDICINTKIHIGKSSVGWLFCFQDQDREDCKWHTYEQVMNWLEKNTATIKAKYIIMDEYNRSLTYQEFKDLVDTKQKDNRNLKNPDNFRYSRNVNGYRFSSGDFS